MFPAITSFFVLWLDEHFAILIPADSGKSDGNSYARKHEGTTVTESSSNTLLIISTSFPWYIQGHWKRYDHGLTKISHIVFKINYIV